MSANDRDFPYKLFGKRLAWSLGYMPLLNVPVRMPNPEPGGAWLDATDVDVLGFNFSANGNTSILVADCKDTFGNGAERIFWVKGLAELLGSDKVFLLKKRIPENAIRLSSKLGITPADSDGIAHLQKALGLDAFKGPYFEADGYTALSGLYDSFPRDSPYRAYCSFFTGQIWSLPYERRLLSTIDVFNHKEIYKTLNADDKTHQSIILLGTLQLALSIALILSRLKLTDTQHWEQRLREELFGGPELLQQRQKFANFVQSQHASPGSSEGILDLPSFPMLFEITYRLFSKRHALNDAIRFIDVARHYHAVSKPFPEWGKTPGQALSNKFAKDILTLFVKANHLDNKFLHLLDEIEFSIGNSDLTLSTGSLLANQPSPAPAPAPALNTANEANDIQPQGALFEELIKEESKNSMDTKTSIPSLKRSHHKKK